MSWCINLFRAPEQGFENAVNSFSMLFVSLFLTHLPSTHPLPTANVTFIISSASFKFQSSLSYHGIIPFFSKHTHTQSVLERTLCTTTCLSWKLSIPWPNFNPHTILPQRHHPHFINENIEFLKGWATCQWLQATNSRDFINPCDSKDCATRNYVIKADDFLWKRTI